MSNSQLRNHHLFPFQKLSTKIATVVRSEQKQLVLKQGHFALPVQNRCGQLPMILMTRAGLHPFYNFESIL